MEKYITISFREARIVLAITFFIVPFVLWLLALPFSGGILLGYLLLGGLTAALYAYSFYDRVNKEQIYHGVVCFFISIGVFLLLHLFQVDFHIDARFVFIVFTIFACLYLINLPELMLFLGIMVVLYSVLIYLHPNIEGGWSILLRFILVSILCFVFVSSRISALQVSTQNDVVYRKLFNNINEGIIMVDNEGVFLDVNKKMLELTGYKKEELLGGVSHEVFLFKEDIVFMRQQTENRTNGSNARYEIRIKKKEGGFIWSLISGIPITNGRGDILGSMGICTDITDLKAVNQNLAYKTSKLEQTNRQLTQTNHDLEQFAYTASHDLQAPLRTIASFSQLLSKRYKGEIDEEADEYIDFIVDACKKMSNLIHGVLDFAKTRTHVLEKQEISLDSLLVSTVKQLHVHAKEKDASIVFGELPPIIGDEIQIRQLFQNLIENALKYSDETKKPIIKISHQVKKDRLLIRVSDNGIGIDEAFQGKIFKLFQRLHLSNSYSGIGIGLSICKKIMENHEGNIHFRSELGEGTTFVLDFPVNILAEKATKKTALGQKAAF